MHRLAANPGIACAVRHCICMHACLPSTSGLQVGYQPEYELGFRAHDPNYMAWQVFGEMFMNDTVIRCGCPA